MHASHSLSHTHTHRTEREEKNLNIHTLRAPFTSRGRRDECGPTGETKNKKTHHLHFKELTSGHIREMRENGGSRDDFQSCR